MKKIWGSILLIIIVLAISLSFYINDKKEKIVTSPTRFNKQFSYLTQDDQLGADYNKAVVFEPDKKYSRELNKNGESLKYILPFKNIVKGKLVVENKTDSKVITKNHFLQGDQLLHFKLSGKDKEKNHFIINTPSKTRSETPVTIMIDPSGTKELTYFPEDTTDPLNGSELSLVRYYLGDASNIKTHSLSKPTTEIKQKELEKYSLLPQPELNKEKKNTINIPSSLVNSTLNVSFLDANFKKISVLDPITIQSKKEKKVELDNHVINLLRDEKQIYMLYYTNEEEMIVTDFLEAVNGYKPFLTSQQNIIKYE